MTSLRTHLCWQIFFGSIKRDVIVGVSKLNTQTPHLSWRLSCLRKTELGWNWRLLPLHSASRKHVIKNILFVQQQQARSYNPSVWLAAETTARAAHIEEKVKMYELANFRQNDKPHFCVFHRLRDQDRQVVTEVKGQLHQSPLWKGAYPQHSACLSIKTDYEDTVDLPFPSTLLPSPLHPQLKKRAFYMTKWCRFREKKRTMDRMGVGWRWGGAESHWGRWIPYRLQPPWKVRLLNIKGGSKVIRPSQSTHSGFYRARRADVRKSESVWAN